MTDNRTYKDRREALIIAVAKKRRKLKLWAIEYKGGKCVVCGYNRYPGALDLHHFFGEKEFSIGDKGYTRAWYKVRQELDKRVLLCATCHREVSAGITKLPTTKVGMKRFMSGNSRQAEI